jgi:hypothetical protein
MVTVRQSQAQNVSRQKSSKPIWKRKRKKVTALAMVAAITGVASVLAHFVPHLNKQPMHTSILSGQQWVQELLEGNFDLNSFLGLH